MSQIESQWSQWSQWLWDENGCRWYSYRDDFSGHREYRAPEAPAAPRSNDSFAGASEPFSRNRYSRFGSELGYTFAEASPSTGTHIPSTTSYQHGNSPYTVSMAPGHLPSAPASNTALPAYTNMHFGASPQPSALIRNSASHSYVPSSHPAGMDQLSNMLHQSSLGGQSDIQRASIPSQGSSGDLVPTSAVIQMREPPIRREPNSPECEKLDPRYRVIPQNDPKKFWRCGRVLMMLWTEPEGHKVQRGGGTVGNSHISTATIFGERAFNEIRRFVVVQDNHGSCLCLAIHTYSKQATLKRNLPDPLNHSAIYTSKDPPSLLPGEYLTKDAIKVTSNSEQLDPLSRLNFTKVYTIEKDVRVLNIGLVHRDSVTVLSQYSPVKYSSRRDNTPGSGGSIPQQLTTSYPPPARSAASNARSAKSGKQRSYSSNQRNSSTSLTAETAWNARSTPSTSATPYGPGSWEPSSSQPFTDAEDASRSSEKQPLHDVAVCSDEEEENDVSPQQQRGGQSSRRNSSTHTSKNVPREKRRDGRK